jgi:hypothetical protein
VTGRNRYGGGFAAVHDALSFESAFLTLPATDALIGCASQVERGLGIAAGRQGVTVQLDGGRSTSSIVPDRPDLASAAIDVHGRAWVGGAGRLWTIAQNPGASWLSAWRDVNWTLPLVALRADVGLVTAVAVDGAILEGRLDAS